MTLEEAIKHAEEKSKTLGCSKCSEEHKQLAVWLKELKCYREGRKITNHLVILERELKMVQLFAWLIRTIICSGLWGVAIYFATNIIFEVPLTAFKCFGLGTVFYFFLVGLRESLKMAFEKNIGE